MKFGVREICDVVLKAKANQKVGNKIFYKNEPVIYFDTLKTSSMEGAATTVYAQGGRGNARLVAWEGERTVTFTMEDALISPAGFMILSGAGLIEADSTHSIKVHTNERIQLKTENFTASGSSYSITLAEEPYFEDNNDWIYIMKLDGNGEVTTEPIIAKGTSGSKTVTVPADGRKNSSGTGVAYALSTDVTLAAGDIILVDYYVEHKSDVSQIEISADKFGGNYYLEASTLFRTTDGHDMPAEFIIPNCKIQSNFTFTMASSGDPSSFTFTMDAFPDYTRFDKTKKVLAAIQIIGESTGAAEKVRLSTDSSETHKWDDATNNVIPKS